MAETEKLNLYQKILKITEEIGKIEKTGRNSVQGYDFIEQSQVVAELRPQLAKWGVAIMPETISRKVERYDVTRSNGKQGVDVHVNVVSRYTVINTDAPDERFICEWDAGEALDSGDKATNKATTASHKYFLMKLFNISDKDDADAESPIASPAAAAKPTQQAYDSKQKLTGPATPKQKQLIKDKLAAIGIADEDMKGYLIEQYGIVGDMSKDDASSVIEDLIEAASYSRPT